MNRCVRSITGTLRPVIGPFSYLRFRKARKYNAVVDANVFHSMLKLISSRGYCWAKHISMRLPIYNISRRGPPARAATGSSEPKAPTEGGDIWIDFCNTIEVTLDMTWLCNTIEESSVILLTAPTEGVRATSVMLFFQIGSYKHREWKGEMSFGNTSCPILRVMSQTSCPVMAVGCDGSAGSFKYINLYLRKAIYLQLAQLSTYFKLCQCSLSYFEPA